jgi:hypothetical protein
VLFRLIVLNDFAMTLIIFRTIHKTPCCLGGKIFSLKNLKKKNEEKSHTMIRCNNERMEEKIQQKLKKQVMEQCNLDKLSITKTSMLKKKHVKEVVVVPWATSHRRKIN